MGTSNWWPIPFCVEALRRIQPRRVLDVGVGFGRWGIAVREFCEVWEGRVDPASWRVEVEGIEAFAPNIAPWHEHFYSRVHLGDARERLPALEGRWDVIIFGDVLEHMEREEAMRLIDLSLDRSAYVLVNIPLGDQHVQGEAYGNPYEQHRSTWRVEDFVRPETRCSRAYYDLQHRPHFTAVLARQDAAGLFVLGTGPVEAETEREIAARWAQLLAGVQAAIDRAGLDARHAEAEAAVLRSELAALQGRQADAARRAADAEQRTGEAEQRTVEANARTEQAQAQTVAVCAEAAALRASLGAVEASVAWRMVQMASRSGLLKLPRAILRAGRRFRGGRNGRAVAEPQPPPATEPAPPSAPGDAAAASAPPCPFQLPTGSYSDDFARLLERRPASFEKVFRAPALMSPQERVALYGLAFALAPERYLEIGTCWGGSAMIVSAALDDLGRGEAIGVDPTPHMTAETAEAIGPRFRLLRQPSPQALPEALRLAGGPFDLVLVDGDHSKQATTDDLEGVLPVVAPRATILVHDAYNDQVRAAIDEFLAAHPDRLRDGGMLAQSPNRVAIPGGTELWGGIYLIHVRHGGPESGDGDCA